MPFFSVAQPLTLPELAAALRSGEALRLPPAAAGQPAPLADGPGSPSATNWLLAHAGGVGPEVPAPLVRRMLLLLAQRLSGATSSGQLAAARRLLDFYHRDVWPVVPEQGALGATDAVPLTHLCLPLLGLGEVDYQGYRLAAADVLGLFGWEALTLPAADGAALLAGHELTLAYATEALERAGHLLGAAEALGALALVVLDAPGSVGYQSAPAASRAAVAYVAQAVQAAGQAGHRGPNNELATNLPSASLALVLDHLAAAGATLGSSSVLRTGQLLAGLAGLPPALAGPELPLGLQVPYRTAASLASQTQQLCAPAASPPGELGGGAASAAPAAVRARRVVENVEQILGIELLVVAQALDLRRAASPDAASPGPGPGPALAAFRAHVTFVARPRALAPDLHRAARFVREYHWA